VFEGRYAIHELLGAGAFGAVYRATQMAMQREVALKVLKAELIREPSLTARFRQEARTLAGLKHPGIIELIDFGETSDGRLFLVTELLTGETLADLLEREAPLPQVRVVSLAIEALDALADAHHAGIIHRDLKPENLFIARQGRRGESLKILDFGIAKLADDDPSRLAVTAAGMTLGSPRFMSPEQCMAGPVSPQSDLYSLGLVLYEAISGRPAFDKQTAMEYMMAHVREEPPPPSIDGMVLRGPHIDLIMQCLEKDPARRPASAAAAAAGFGAVHSRLPTAMGVASARPGAGEAGEATQFVGAEATQFVGAEATQFVGARPPAPSDSAAETVAVPVDAAVARAFAAAAEGTAAAPSTTDDAWTVVVPSPLAARGGGGAAARVGGV
jgi:serine/threonine protein kinase